MKLKSKKPGRLVIISSPSGGGKTTIVERLLEQHANFKRSISWTTREPRPAERNGVDYVFITRADFLKKRAAGFFLEWANVHGQLYGTPLSSCLGMMSDGYDVVLAIDVQGMRKIKKKAAKKLALVTIFLMPPSLEVLKSRLANRKTETAGQVKKRLQAAEKEMKQSRLYGHVIVNRQIDKTIRQINKILFGKK